MTSRHPLALEETEIEDRKQAEALLPGEKVMRKMQAASLADLSPGNKHRYLRLIDL